MTERVLSELVELDIDKCQNVYGVSPCTAGRVESGTAQAGASTTLTLRALASAVDDAYNGMTARLGDGRERRVLDYVGATKVATVEKRWPTNLLVRSEEIDNASWTKDNIASVTANSANDSAGALTLDKLTENTTATVIHTCRQNVGSVNLNQSCVATCEVRASGRDKFYLLLFDAGATTNFVNGQFDIAAKTTAISHGGNGSGGVAQLEDLGDGLFRLKVRGIPNTAVGAGTLRVEFRLRDAAGAQSYTGDGVSGAHVGRFTAEQAGDFDAEYLKTVAAAIALPTVGSTYDIIDRPNACYNTFRTCQDKANFRIAETGTAQAGSSTTLTLAAGATAADDAFNGMPLRLLDGSGRERRIADYVGATKVATVETRWPTNRLLHSEAAHNAAWSKTGNTTVSAADDISVQGITLNKIASTDGATFRGIIQSAWVPMLASEEALVSGFMIAGASNQYAIRVDDAGGTTNSSLPINWVNGVPAFGAVSQTGALQLIDSGIEDWGGGLYRAWMRVRNTGVVSIADVRARYYIRWSTGAPLVAEYGYWGGYQAESAPDLGEYKKTTSPILALPDATTPYEIDGTKTLRFTGLGAPIDKTAPARPYIARLTTAPTELDLEEAISRRASSSVVMVDETDSDVELDPYVRDRTTAARGTFWTRFFARNLNYGGRAARVKRAFVDRGVFGAYTTERFIIEAAKGPDARGEVTLSLKDPIKLLDRAKAPTPTSGKLALDFGLNDLTFTLDGTGSQYPSSGYVRIGDEVVRYASRAGEVFTLTDGTYRGQFGSTAAAAEAGDGVQLCLVYQDQSFSAVVEDLHNLGGILDADLDLAGLAEEEATWLGDDFRVASVCITDPEDITTLLRELLQPANMTTWWSPTEQKVKFKVYAPASPAAISVTTLDDTAELMDQSVGNERLEDLRITFGAVNYGLRTAVDNPEEPKSYKQGAISVDLDAESANEYNERRVLTINSRFYGPDNDAAMRVFIQRYVARHRDAPERIEFVLDPKDGSLTEGQVCDLQTFRLVEADGTTRTARVLIVRREPRGVDVKYAARITNFDRPYGFIAPDGTSNYPNNNGYACISQDNGLMTNGDPAYLVI